MAFSTEGRSAGEPKDWCPSTFPWEGHPGSEIPCHEFEGHPEPHSFWWIDKDSEEHALEWTDEAAAKAWEGNR